MPKAKTTTELWAEIRELKRCNKQYLRLMTQARRELLTVRCKLKETLQLIKSV